MKYMIECKSITRFYLTVEAPNKKALQKFFDTAELDEHDFEKGDPDDGWESVEFKDIEYGTWGPIQVEIDEEGKPLNEILIGTQLDSAPYGS